MEKANVIAVGLLQDRRLKGFAGRNIISSANERRKFRGTDYR
jgi:hypothetical protein